MTMASNASAPDRLVFTGRGMFLKTLRARVDDHFAGRPRCDDARLHRKAALIAVWFVASYVLLLSVRNGWWQVLLCLSCALASSGLGFNVFHDANHGSFSSSKRVNLLLGRLTSMTLGPSRYLWCHKHNVLHHVFTSVFQWDDDIETRGHLRLSPRQPWAPKYRNQHRFFLLLYALSTVEWFYLNDIVQYARLRRTYQPIPPLSRAEKVEFLVSKAIHLTLFVGLPLALLPVWRVIAGLLLYHVVFGLALTLIFQIAHGTEKAAFPAPTEGATAVIEEEWAAHELRTTVNFAIRNRLLNWFAGGLNFQVEHHLFPHVSHTHYPEISPIVRRTAEEFGLPYNLHETYRDAVRSHYRLLRQLGRPPAATGARY